MSIDLTIVVPLHNEAVNVDALCARLMSVLRSLGVIFEVVFVNDGSADDTLAKLLAASGREPTLKVVDLSRRFGKEAALSCGLAHASGRAVVTMDGDLQHPPEVIPELLARWREGYEMVYAVRRHRDDQDTESRMLARTFYWLFDRMSEVRLPRDAGDFRLLDRKVVDAIIALPERSRFMKGIFAWVGFRSTGVLFDADDRAGGRSQWTRLRKLRFALDGLTSFSNLPLRVWSVVGAIISLFAFLYIVFRLIRVAIYGVDVPGYESTLMAVLFLGGVQLLSLGIIGDYLGRTFDEAKRRPLYIVRERYGMHGNPDRRLERDLLP
jgi:glycosyltransferase involved in cell wall biosynthesis